MARHFGPQYAKSSYAAMGQSLHRPTHSSGGTALSTSQRIDRARSQAARAARITKKK